MKRHASSREDLYSIIERGQTITKPYLYAEVAASSDYQKWRAQKEMQHFRETCAWLAEIGAVKEPWHAMYDLTTDSPYHPEYKASA